MHDFSTLERYRAIVDDWDAFCDALRRPLPLTGVVNTLRTNRDELVTRFDARGIETSVLDWYPNAIKFDRHFKVGNTFEYAAGLFNVQEEAALTACALLDPQPGERILDLCAAPGNKTVQIGLAMNNLGTVIANDRSATRMRAIRSTIDRFGLMNITTLNHDGSNLPRTCGRFDRVLADVPCSCEGTSRKNPNVLATAEAQIQKLVGIQRALLKRAIALCEDGGIIAYATCTYAPEENEGVIADVIEELGPEVVTLLPTRLVNFKSSPGLTKWQGREYGEQFSNAMRVWPHHNDTGGFFVALLQKHGESVGEDITPFDETSRDVADLLFDYFGIEPPEDLLFFQPNTKSVQVTNADHLPIPTDFISGFGLKFATVARAYPKMTTGAAMAFGRYATRRILQFSAVEAACYLRRENVTREPAVERGYFMVQYDGLTLGLAWSDGVTIESNFPKSLALAPHAKPFEEIS